MSQLIKDIEGVECIVDEILVWGETMEQHDQRLRHLLERVRENNLKSIAHWSMFTSDCRWQRRLAVRYNVGFLEQNGCTH